MVGAITETWSFETLVKSSGYRNVVTMDNPPTALVHDGAVDERTVTNGIAAYYVSQRDLSLDATERARQLLQRLHDLGDWAAGEIVERRRRDEARLSSGYCDLKPRLSVHQMFVRRFVRRHPGSTVKEISVGASLAVSEVQALTAELCGRGILVASGQRETRYELSASEEARYREFDNDGSAATTP
ncbi:hypothetical protein HJB80_23320 [Rhizobium lentis]|uniref:hypothetical protein n=1 Tax=Rhizobium lentis TaxID=1138194 RepID=UPI001C83D35F|nr:hypothetical protein [Rhizobium lentis]MBX5135544.1 hypothetical protein [Rhizobium lentis]